LQPLYGGPEFVVTPLTYALRAKLAQFKYAINTKWSLIERGIVREISK